MAKIKTFLTLFLMTLMILICVGQAYAYNANTIRIRRAYTYGPYSGSYGSYGYDYHEGLRYPYPNRFTQRYGDFNPDKYTYSRADNDHDFGINDGFHYGYGYGYQMGLRAGSVNYYDGRWYY